MQGCIMSGSGRTNLVFISLTVSLKAAVKLADVGVLMKKNRRIHQSVREILCLKKGQGETIFQMTNKVSHFNRAAIQNKAFGDEYV
uniref:Uncharacterized protein n=1 Tax=Romanomermis culicivorax TaxID=13658 RepID=A0A915IKL5_ROMCU